MMALVRRYGFRRPTQAQVIENLFRKQNVRYAGA